MTDQGESVAVEFKRTVESAEKIAKTLVAFANTRGGTLLVGVEDDGSITGIASELREMTLIEEAAISFCEPPIVISYQSVWQGIEQVLLIAIAESAGKPHYVVENSGERVAYVRAGNASVPASKNTVSLLNAGVSANLQTWLQNKNARTLLTYLKQHQSITVKKFAKLVNISESRAAKLLRELTRHGVLLLHDRQPPVHYTLV